MNRIHATSICILASVWNAWNVAFEKYLQATLSWPRPLLWKQTDCLWNVCLPVWYVSDLFGWHRSQWVDWSLYSTEKAFRWDSGPYCEQGAHLSVTPAMDFCCSIAGKVPRDPPPPPSPPPSPSPSLHFVFIPLSSSLSLCLSGCYTLTLTLPVL